MESLCTEMQPKAIDWATALFPGDPPMAERIAESMRDYANKSCRWLNVELAARMRDKYPPTYSEGAFIGDGQEQRLFGAGVASGVDRVCAALLREPRALCVYVLPERYGKESQQPKDSP